MAKAQTKGMKLISVILGTLIGGFLFRCRGESGFGSSWGLYSVGLVIILVVYIFYGKRNGMKYELIPLGAFLTGLGVTGYATVLEQMSGILMSDTSYFYDDMPVVHKIFPGGGVTLEQYPEVDMELAFAPVNPYRAMIIILIMGFTLVPFFSFFIGTLFSEKEYKLQHYAIAVVIFFAVSTLVKATVAHPILRAINPEQVKFALLSLQDRGFDYSSMTEAYMKHFLDRGWTQEFQFVENYYMSIEHISDVFGVFSIILYAAIIKKDAITSVVTFLISLLTSVATTAFTLFPIAPYESGILEGISCPRPLQNGEGWAIWEFSTGAAIGFFTMLIIALLPNKYTQQSQTDNKPWFENRIVSFVYNFIAFVFLFVVVPSRVILIRINKLINNLGIVDEGSSYGEIACAVVSVIIGILLIGVFKKNILVLGDTPLRVDTRKFALTTLSAYSLMCCFAYFFLNHAYIFTLPYSKITGFKSALYELTNSTYFSTTVMMVTFILFAVIFFPMKKKLAKK